MRTIAIAVLISSTVAEARPSGLVEHSRATTTTERAQAANQIAAQLRAPTAGPDGRAVAQAIAMTAVLSDDPVVRATIIDALVEATVITRPASARIPTLGTLDRQLETLVANRPAGDVAMPRATTCSVSSVDARGATIACHGSRCAGSCIHVTTTLTLRAEVRWTVVRQTSNRLDDGACGCCMHFE